MMDVTLSSSGLRHRGLKLKTKKMHEASYRASCDPLKLNMTNELSEMPKYQWAVDEKLEALALKIKLCRFQTQGNPFPGKPKNHKVSVAIGSSLGSVSVLAMGVGLFLSWRQRYHQQIFLDVNDQRNEEVCLGNLKRFQFRELQLATNNFSSKNILGKGGFGNVYKAQLQDGTVAAVKRLKDGNAAGGEIQFQTEVEMISLAVHRNLLNESSIGIGTRTFRTKEVCSSPIVPNLFGGSFSMPNT